MKLLVVLFAVVAMAFASGTFTGEISGTYSGFAGTDETLTSYVYDQADQMSTVGASFTDYAVIDDYTGVPANVDTYITWGITTGASPAELEILVVADDGTDSPIGAPTVQTAYPVSLVDTGVTYGGYVIWETTMDLSSAPISLETGCWIGPHRNDTVTWYPVGGLTVTGIEGFRTLAAGWAWERFHLSLEEGDLFKVVGGIPTSLSRSTWAGIKNNF